jgi:hypothetical protein
MDVEAGKLLEFGCPYHDALNPRVRYFCATKAIRNVGSVK